MALLRIGYRLGYLDENPAKPRTPSAKHDHKRSQSRRCRENARTRAYAHPEIRIDVVVGASIRYCKTFPAIPLFLPSEPQSFSTSGRAFGYTDLVQIHLANTSRRFARYDLLTLPFPTRSFQPSFIPAFLRIQRAR